MIHFDALLKLKTQHYQHYSRVLSFCILFIFELMDNVVRKIVQPSLKGMYHHMSYVGSSYELSALPGSSDYDIQVFLDMLPGPGKHDIPKPNTGRIHECDRDGWRKIFGGPSNLVTENGFLSAYKVSFTKDYFE